MKCAVSDFDRTLYVERMIGEEDKNAVLNWQKSGNLFVIATGRNLGTIKPIFESYGFSPDFWILNNTANAVSLGISFVNRVLWLFAGFLDLK